jgi:hypothetical protein
MLRVGVVCVPVRVRLPPAVRNASTICRSRSWLAWASCAWAAVFSSASVAAGQKPGARQIQPAAGQQRQLMQGR